MEYSVVIVKDTQEGGYIGMCRELPEAKSQGETIDELLTAKKLANLLLKRSIRRSERHRQRDVARDRRILADAEIFMRGAFGKLQKQVKVKLKGGRTGSKLKAT